MVSYLVLPILPTGCADTALGGTGDDLPGQGGRLEGGPGNDTVRGQRGDDTVQDQVNDDSHRLFGVRGADLVDGGRRRQSRHRRLRARR